MNQYHLDKGWFHAPPGSDTHSLIADTVILDFAVLAEVPDFSKYESLVFPETDVWGVIMPQDCALANHGNGLIIRKKD